MRTGTRSQISNLKLTTVAVCLTLASPLAVRAAPPSEESLGRAALAEEFASAGIKAVTRQEGAPAPAMIRQSTAMLRAACNECSFEPRFPRLLVEACDQLKDQDGEIEALTWYRAIQLPRIQNDQFAQVRLIDLYTAKSESLDKKLEYLKSLLGAAQLPDPVKSHVAWVCSNLMTQKFDTQGSQAMLAQSLQLNPLNPEALQSQYVAAQASGSLQRQAAALVALLTSNPAQPAVMGTLADDLASVGLPDQAVTWYKRSFIYSQQLGMGLDPGRYLNYSSALFMMDQGGVAQEAASMLLASQPSNIGAATIGLLAARQAVKPPAGGGAPADPEVLQRARETAVAALTAQLGTLNALLHGVSGPASTQAATTQPVNVISDIVENAPKVRDIKNRPDLTKEVFSFCTGYAAALSDLIFYYTYFDPQPDNANKLLDSLRLLRPADDAELTRLEGFAFLADGKRDEAKVKFSAVADHDPLAKMGLLLMDPAGPDTSAAASKLVTDHPAGLLGAILLDGLRDRGGKPVSTPDSDAVAKEAAAFPIKLLDFLDRSHTPEFYNLVAEPYLHISVDYDEPALVDVTIKNVGDFDLSIGPDAAIRPDLWFDVATQGGNNPFFSGVAYDHIAGPLVLKAHHLDQAGTDQVVRVDTGPLNVFLASRPTIAVSMLFSVFTNPIGEQAGVVPGPGGYRKQFNSPMERRASPVGTTREVQALIDPAMNGRIDQKIRTLELLTNYVFVLQGRVAQLQNQLAAPAAPATPDQPAANAGVGGLAPPSAMAPQAPPNANDARASIQNMQALINSFTSTIRSTLRDPSPIVRYWAETTLAQLATPEERRLSASTMIQGKDWEERMLGLMLANDLPKDQGRAIAQGLTGDSVRQVKDFAKATVEVADLPPATRPTTAP